MENQEQSAEEIFSAALDLHSESREAYLARACGPSSNLRVEVDKLLFDYHRMRGFFDGPLLTAVDSDSPSLSEQFMPAGQKLGRYTVLGPIGSGGMGVVYRARDESWNALWPSKFCRPAW